MPFYTSDMDNTDSWDSIINMQGIGFNPVAAHACSYMCWASKVCVYVYVCVVVWCVYTGHMHARICAGLVRYVCVGLCMCRSICVYMYISIYQYICSCMYTPTDIRVYVYMSTICLSISLLFVYRCVLPK